MAVPTRQIHFRFWLCLIRAVGVIVPRRLRADWRREWEAELRHREELLDEWDRLDWRSKFDLLRRSASAFWDAVGLQPKRLEDEMFQDLRFGARMLLKRPGLIIIATLCLAMGTGANVLIFSLVNAVVLRPVAGVRAPQELAVMLHRNDRNSFDLTSYPDYLDYRARNRSFAGLLAYRSLEMNMGGDGVTERLQGAIASGNYFSVLGVARNSKHRTPDEEARPVMYIPLSQQYEGPMILNLRSAVEPLGQVGAVRRVAQQLDPNLPLFEIKTMAQRVKESFWPTRTMSNLVGVFGAIALLLACAGLYGVLSYMAARRTREIGLRLALGAQTGDVLQLVIGHGLRLALVGVAFGLIAAFGLTRVLAGFLHGVSATDPLTFAVIPPVLIAVALLACYLPARRATKVDPLTAIRRE